MKILVTGATSGLGRNAVEWLLARDIQVHATGRDQSIGQQLQELGAEFTALDLAVATDQQLEQLITGCQVVWHCAARSSPWGNYQDFYQDNVIVTERLAHLAGQNQITRFIHVSTPAIYFDFQHHDNLQESYRAVRFANHYAETKYLAEQRLQALLATYPATTYLMIRPRGLFGPYDRVILPRILAQLQGKNETLRLPGGGIARLDLTFVLNVVYAMYLATTQSGLATGAIYNITNQQPAPLKSLLRQLLHDQMGLNYRIKAVPYPILYGVATVLEGWAAISGKEPLLTRYSVAAVYFDMVLNQDRAQNELGYHPCYSLEEGIAITGQWLRQQRAS